MARSNVKGATQQASGAARDGLRARAASLATSLRRALPACVGRRLRPAVAALSAERPAAARSGRIASGWRAVAVLAIAWVLWSCGVPLPADKTAYAGEWRADHILLVLTPEGRVYYETSRHGGSTKLDLPLKGFDGDHFTAGVGPLSTTFVVSEPPHQTDDGWVMTVDGVRLFRVAP